MERRKFSLPLAFLLGVCTLGNRMSKDAQDQIVAALAVLALIIVEVML